MHTHRGCSYFTFEKFASSIENTLNFHLKQTVLWIKMNAFLQETEEEEKKHNRNQVFLCINKTQHERYVKHSIRDCDFLPRCLHTQLNVFFCILLTKWKFKFFLFSVVANCLICLALILSINLLQFLILTITAICYRRSIFYVYNLYGSCYDYHYNYLRLTQRLSRQFDKQLRKVIWTFA